MWRSNAEAWQGTEDSPRLQTVASEASSRKWREVGVEGVSMASECWEAAGEARGMLPRGAVGERWCCVALG